MKPLSTLIHDTLSSKNISYKFSKHLINGYNISNFHLAVSGQNCDIQVNENESYIMFVIKVFCKNVEKEDMTLILNYLNNAHPACVKYYFDINTLEFYVMTTVFIGSICPSSELIMQYYDYLKKGLDLLIHQLPTLEVAGIPNIINDSDVLPRCAPPIFSIDSTQIIEDNTPL